MRILGYKRWQVLVSFMLESLGIALLGGLLGIIISGVACWLYAALGFQVNSIVSSGQGGGKTVVLKLIASPDILAAGTAVCDHHGSPGRAGALAVSDAIADSGIASLIVIVGYPGCG
jgi:ABC-type antimicrobial peptide transport system permease subunit